VALAPMHALHGHRVNPHQELLMIPVWLDDAKERAHDPRPHGGGPRRPIAYPIEDAIQIRTRLERDWIMAGCRLDWRTANELWACLQEWRA
jgi:hypothetical protein